VSKRLLEYDPLTKTSTWFEGNGKGGFSICQSQDVEAHLEKAKRLRNNAEYKRQGIKNDWYHFATVPMTVIHEIMLKYGLHWDRKEDIPKFEKIIQRDYPKLLTVDRI
jgi:hypothetical protein